MCDWHFFDFVRCFFPLSGSGPGLAFSKLSSTKHYSRLSAEYYLGEWTERLDRTNVFLVFWSEIAEHSVGTKHGICFFLWAFYLCRAFCSFGVFFCL
jgi:hypothetical protein